MSIMEKLQTIKDNTSKVFESGILEGNKEGYEAALTEFLAMYQFNGTRKIYQYAFYGWDINWLKYLPYKDLSVMTQVSNMFSQTENNIDLSEFFKTNNITFSTTNVAGSINSLFSNTNFTRIPSLDFRGLSGVFTQVVLNCPNLETIDNLIFKDAGAQRHQTGNYGLIQNCLILKNIAFSGTAADGLRLKNCPMLSKESLLSFLNICTVNDGTARTVTLTETCIDGETSTEGFINSDTELSTAFTTATNNGYTIVFSD